MGYLKLIDVIADLKSKFGFEIRSTQALNKLLNEMGIIEKKYGFWSVTDYGKKFTIFEPSMRQDFWRPEVVWNIAEYLSNKE